MFTEVVKQAKSVTQGTVTEVGVESQDGDQAQVIVAVTVRESNGGVPEDHPKMWRMRIGVQKVADGAKVSAVQFVP
jgi:Mce-associated membrane protein